MPSITIEGGFTLETDDDGFIQQPDKWNEKVAAVLARGEGINKLIDDHWKVIKYLRDYYLKFGVAPMIRRVCKETGFDMKHIYKLFPSGPAKGKGSL